MNVCIVQYLWLLENEIICMYSYPIISIQAIIWFQINSNNSYYYYYQIIIIIIILS